MKHKLILKETLYLLEDEPKAKTADELDLELNQAFININPVCLGTKNTIAITTNYLALLEAMFKNKGLLKLDTEIFKKVIENKAIWDEKPEDLKISLQTYDEGLETFIKFLDALKPIIAKCNETVQKTIPTELDKLEQDLKSSLEVEDISTKLDDIKELITTLNTKTSVIITILLNDILAKETTIKNSIDKLKTYVKNIQDNIKVINTLDNKKTTIKTIDLGDVIVQTLIERLATAKENLNKVKSTITTQNSLLNNIFLEKLEIKLNSFNSKLTSDIVKVNKSTTDLNEWQKQEWTAAGSDKPESPITRDWETEFRKAVDTDARTNKSVRDADSATAKLWDVYYKTVWPNTDDVQTMLKRIVTPFQKEIQAYGYTEATSPFVVFLKDNIGKGDFVAAINANPVAYACIHNAVVENLLTLADLRGIGLFKRDNIIFNPLLYKQNTAVINTYLQQQAIVRALYEKNNLPFKNYVITKPDGSKEEDILNTKYGADKKQQFILDLFYKDGVVLTQASVPGNPTSGFKSTEEINDILNKCFGSASVAETKENLKAAKTTTDLEAITKENYGRVITKLIKDGFNRNTTVWRRFLTAMIQFNSVLSVAEREELEKKYNITVRLTETEARQTINNYKLNYDIDALCNIDRDNRSLFINFINGLGDSLLKEEKGE